MFTALGNIFLNKPRQAEETDTRQALQRHDPEFENRRKKKGGSEAKEIEENATVSVSALKHFLENFLKNADEQGKENTETQEPEDTETEQTQESAEPQQAESSPQGGQAAQAASAYAYRASANEKSSILFETTDKATGPSLDLSAADIRTIHVLIEDLTLLEKQDIEYLNIERAATFLDSLVNAVSAAKKHLSL